MRGFFLCFIIYQTLSLGQLVKTLAVIVTTPPYSPLTTTAITYIKAAIAAEINIVGVFFYQDGVMHANQDINIASDEYQAIQEWQQLHQAHQLPLHICVTAAEKRGISCEAIDGGKVNEAFTVSGLGELVELSTKASRVVQF